MKGCFECLRYCCETCQTKIFFKELYRDLDRDNTKLFFTMECEHCIKNITKCRFKARKHLRVYPKKKKMNDKNPTNRYGDIKYFYIPDYIPSSMIISISCSGNTKHMSHMIRNTHKTYSLTDKFNKYRTYTKAHKYY